MVGSGTPRVRTTPAALAAIERLRTRHGPLMFVQSGGCCDGSSPIRLAIGRAGARGRRPVGGPIDGWPFYADRELYERRHERELALDVSPGATDTFSLEGSDDVHFVLR